MRDERSDAPRPASESHVAIATGLDPRREGSLYEYLDWDSTFFGRRIARVRASTLTPDRARAILDACRRDGIECLYFLADASDGPTVRVAEDHRFRLVDVRMTLKCRVAGVPASSLPPRHAIRPSRPDDVAALRSIARRGFPLTRFHYDPNFPQRLADALYERWIELSCGGYADTVLVAEVASEPAGFVSCHARPGGTGRLGLLGVGQDRQGRGVGHDLVRAAIGWYAQKGIDVVQVVTQGRNCDALRLYQGCGFVIEQVELWYHRWLDLQGRGSA